MVVYLSDADINYRDKKLSLPYFEYKIQETDKLKNDNKGHILIKNGKTYIRYEYDLKKYRV